MAPQVGSKPSTPHNDTVMFFLNGEEQTISPTTVPLSTRLVDYIRYHRNAKGTKVMCREGGCGACVVVASVPDAAAPQGGTKTFSVQACQLLVYACAGWSIETVESLGNRHTGYHIVQKALAGFYGTQCGYCSPGMVMTMYGELQRTGSITSAQAETALDGNICRCTGYRPILDAFKSMAVDGDPGLKRQLHDIEDAYKKTCPKTGVACEQKCGGGCPSRALLVRPPTEELTISSDTGRWIRPVDMKGISNALKIVEPNEKVLLVAGNTGSGVFKHDGPYSVFISLEGVPELQQTKVSSAHLVVGARVPLTTCIELFREVALGPKAVPGYGHLTEIADHWHLVANLAVRNNGTWAGNLILKNRHTDFPSDIFLTLSVCDVTVTIMEAATGAVSRVEVIDIPEYDMKNKVIISMSIPPMPPQTYVRSFKITPRAVNAHAYVNAALRLNVNADSSVTEPPVLLFGGLGAHFVSATKTQQYLAGKKLSDADVIQEAARQLAEEAVPAVDPHQGTVEYRRQLVQCLLYKTIIWILKDTVSPALRSAGDKLVRSLNSGQQDFDLNQDAWPLAQPIPKVESDIQVSGEAEYVDDLPVLPGELHGAFVQTTVANAKINNVDAAEALIIPGVVTFVTANDIPGINDFITTGSQDKIFATDRSEFAGQSVGLIVAQDRDTALLAAKKVKVAYSDRKTPVLTIKDSIKQGKVVPAMDFFGQQVKPITEGNYKESMAAAANKVQGQLDLNTQYHFPMELFVARVNPTEDGYDLAAPVQHVAEAQSVVARCLNIPANSINMSLRRIGGAFGYKISRINIVTCAAAVAAAKTKRPVRVVLDMTTQMTVVGWREPYYSSYEVGFDNTGKIQAVGINIYADPGFVANEASVSNTPHVLHNVYTSDSWNFEVFNAMTDTAANTWCRTPGHVEGIATIENVMEHVAAHLGADPLAVRVLNLAPNDDLGPNVFKDSILPLLMEKAAVDQRKLEVEEFNKSNRWRKRGLSVIPMRYPFPYPPSFRYSAQVIVYGHDGTVAIEHGGAEMGQGINTKASQVAASFLGVPLSIIKIKPCTTVAGANSFVTGGSYGSDLVCHAVKVCCERLKARIDAVRGTLPDPNVTWPDLIKACLHKDVDISERYWTASNEHPTSYTIWGGTCVEVEVDVLTGQHVTRRVDLIEDAGRSLSPYVDVGQVEGSYVMGQGMFTTEYMQHDAATGQKMVTGTWEYKPPTALDIPADFRITLLPNAPNPYGVLRSKATGEPPLCMSYGVVTALRQAIASARADAGLSGWFEMPSPLTVERIQQLCLVNSTQFVLTK